MPNKSEEKDSLGRQKANDRPDEERHEMVLRALRGESKTKLAKEYDVSRTWVYEAVNIASTAPEARLEAAEKELEFRRDVVALLAAENEEWEQTAMDERYERDD